MFSKYFKELLNDKELIRRCISVSVPLMLQALVVSSVTLVDNIMIGELGDLCISGVASANRYYLVVYFAVVGMVSSGVIFLAQYYGANDQDNMQQTFRISIVTSLFLAFFLSLFAYFKPETIIRFIINDEEVISIGSRYLRICCLSYIPMVISNCIGSCIRTLGNPKLPMYISIGSILLNIFFDYALIFGNFGFPRMEVEGAALATLIARLIEMSVYLFALKKSDYPFKTSIFKLFEFKGILLRSIIIMAIPLILNEFLFTFGQTSLLKFYSYRGVVVNTAHTIAGVISDLFFVLFSGMSTAANVLIGIPLGAGEMKKAKDNGYKLLIFSCLLAVVFALMMFASSFLVPILYRNASSESLSIAKAFLRTMSFFFMIYTFNCQIFFTLRTGGETKAALIMDSMFMWCFVIPLVYILSYFTNINVILVYIIAQSTDFIKMFLAYHLFRKESWLKNLTI